MKKIPLTGRVAAGRFALVDDGDYELVAQYRWHAARRGRSGREDQVYAATSTWSEGARKSVFMHTLIAGFLGVDHVNHDGLDNQRHNLRRATRSQNGGNKRRRRTASSQYKGVSWAADRKLWGAQIVRDGTLRLLGWHKDEADAARAYDAAARELFGPFACVNFPGPGESPAAWVTEQPATAAVPGVPRPPEGVGRSPYIGVLWDSDRNDRWYAVIKSGGRTRRLGFYFSDIRAALVRDEAARELHGDAARLNFPDGLTPELEARMLADEKAGEAVTAARKAAGNQAKSESMRQAVARREPRTGTCETCGKEYETLAASPTRFCSRECQAQDYNDRRRVAPEDDGRRNRPARTATCTVCGEEFTHHSNKEVLYCSGACSSRAYKRRKKAAAGAG